MITEESSMLGLPFKSIFADKVQIGDRMIDGSQLKSADTRGDLFWKPDLWTMNR